MDVINSTEFKFGRLLASPDTRTRHATILKLQTYLKSRCDPAKTGDNGGLSTIDLMKLWKGLWHTLYLADGVSVQDEVSNVLANLMWSLSGTVEEDEYAGRLYLEMEEEEDDEDDDDLEILDIQNDTTITTSQDSSSSSSSDTEEEDPDDTMNITNKDNDDNDDDDDDDDEDDDTIKHCRGAHLSALYARTYFRTLSQNWSLMDKYRIDKFYTLTRIILREIYRYMAARHWNLGIVRLFNDAIFEEVLRDSNQISNGIRFHIIDCVVDELAKVNAEDKTNLKLTEVTFLDCLEPFFALTQRVQDTVVHKRCMEAVFLKFLIEYSVVSDNFENDAEEEKQALIFDQVHVLTVAQFIFELASNEETMDKYRQELYDMHKVFAKRIKAVGRDVSLDNDEEEDGNVCNHCDNHECTQECGHDDEYDEIEGDDIEDDTIEMEEEEKENEEAIVVKNIDENDNKKKKKKKKSKKEAETIEKRSDEESPSEVLKQDNVEHKSTKTSSKKNKKKKTDACQDSQTELEDETIIISTEQQKEAAAVFAKMEAKNKAALEKKAKKKNQTKDQKEQVENNNDDGEGTKRVKFGKMNMSKSYKASIKDLQKIDPQKILSLTPEKSILLKKKKKVDDKEEVGKKSVKMLPVKKAKGSQKHKLR